ncbi:hypothetical protein ACFQ1E_09960 [Sphingomonas canadensis]|uniref:Uncharacterized protein n=1 Tax=Sphingomonas canadensis TaxID=1219257 RepID=A0ABW3H5E6_9SPHN|nr:hypothetical protein [Sphingomonas canadensis]MCW3836556.1 hypothetical protein [Sphingomonas canadensis]
MHIEEHTRPEPQRSRAVFSTEDFRLIREAVGAHLQQIKDSPESVKFSNLYHRLGRVA